VAIWPLVALWSNVLKSARFLRIFLSLFLAHSTTMSPFRRLFVLQVDKNHQKGHVVLRCPEKVHKWNTWHSPRKTCTMWGVGGPRGWGGGMSLVSPRFSGVCLHLWSSHKSRNAVQMQPVLPVSERHRGRSMWRMPLIRREEADGRFEEFCWHLQETSEDREA